MSHLPSRLSPLCDELITQEYDTLMDNNGYYRRLLETVRDRRDIPPSHRGLYVLTSFMVRAARTAMEHPTVAVALPKEVYVRGLIGQSLVDRVVEMADLQREPNRLEEFHRKHGLAETVIDYTDHGKVKVFGTAVFRDISWIGGGVVHLLKSHPEVAHTANEVLHSSGRLHRIGRVRASTLAARETITPGQYIPRFYLELAPDTSNPTVQLSEYGAWFLRINKEGGCPAMRIIEPDTTETVFRSEWSQLVDVLIPANATAEMASDRIY